MKYFLFILLLAIPLVALGQYNNNPNKIRLGYQTTGTGLIAYGSGAPLYTPINVNNANHYQDTTNNVLYYYDFQGSTWVVFSAADGNGLISGLPIGTVAINADSNTLSITNMNNLILTGSGTFTIQKNGAGNFNVKAPEGSILQAADIIDLNVDTSVVLRVEGQPFFSVGHDGIGIENPVLDSVTETTHLIGLPGTSGIATILPLSTLATQSALVDTAAAIRADIPAALYYQTFRENSVDMTQRGHFSFRNTGTDIDIDLRDDSGADETYLEASIKADAITNVKMANNAINTAEIVDDAVTYAKMQNVAGSLRLLGNPTASTNSPVVEIPLGSGISFSGGSLVATGSAANLVFTGTASPVTLNSTTGTDVTFTSGDGIDLTATGSNMNIIAEVTPSVLADSTAAIRADFPAAVNSIYTGAGLLPDSANITNDGFKPLKITHTGFFGGTPTLILEDSTLGGAPLLGIELRKLGATIFRQTFDGTDLAFNTFGAADFSLLTSSGDINFGPGSGQIRLGTGVTNTILPKVRPGSNSFWRFNSDGSGEYVDATTLTSDISIYNTSSSLTAPRKVSSAGNILEFAATGVAQTSNTLAIFDDETIVGNGASVAFQRNGTLVGSFNWASNRFTIVGQKGTLGDFSTGFGITNTVGTESIRLTAGTGGIYLDSDTAKVVLTNGTSTTILPNAAPGSNSFWLHRTDGWGEYIVATTLATQSALQDTAAAIRADFPVGGSVSVISPAQITADQDNYNPSGWSSATIVRIESDDFRAITSFAAGADGEVKRLLNVGDFPIYLPGEHPDGVDSNRIVIGYDYFIWPKRSAEIMYDNTLNRWMILSEYEKGKNEIVRYMAPGSVTTADWGNLAFINHNSGAVGTSVGAANSFPSAFSFATNALTSGGAGVYFSKSTSQFTYTGDSHFSADASVGVTTLSDGTDTYTAALQILPTPTSTSVAVNNSFGIKYTHGSNSGKWEGFSIDNSGTVSTVDLGVTVAVDVIYNLRVELDKGRSEIRCYVDGEMKGRITSNLPSDDVGLAAKVIMLKSAGTTSRLLYLFQFGSNAKYK